MSKHSLLAAGFACAVLMAGTASARAASTRVTGGHKPPFTLGWANIYSVPTWMKQATDTITQETDELKKAGLVSKRMITDAQGNATMQIRRIRSMIDAKVDAILVDAGSATALDRVIADACSKGIAVVNFDSLVDTGELTAKVDTDQVEWGMQAADRLVKTLDGKGKIIVMNGPAGISVSDDRRKGTEPVLKAHPDLRVVAGTNTECDLAPAQEAMSNLLFNNAEIDGALAAYAAVQVLQGKDVPAFVKVPPPVIDESGLDSSIARATDFPADGYIHSPFDKALFDKLLAR